ncbi:MAG: PKD domain-containing protein [Candidatus Margulisbacteria bacterium]|nr:PKD domain-containing protein [Candidatus Margulisiibacteriota bacterium]
MRDKISGKLGKLVITGLIAFAALLTIFSAQALADWNETTEVDFNYSTSARNMAPHPITDPSGNLHIIYCKYNSTYSMYNLYHKYMPAGSSEYGSETQLNSEFYSYFSVDPANVAVAVNSSGTLTVAWKLDGYDTVCYSEGSISGWSTPSHFTSSNAIYNIDIAVSPSDDLAYIYYTSSSGLRFYVNQYAISTGSDTNLTYYVLGYSLGTTYLDVAIDDAETKHIVYGDSNNILHTIRYWNSYTLSEQYISGTTAAYPSIVVTPNVAPYYVYGDVHIVWQYVDGSNYGIGYAKYDPVSGLITSDDAVAPANSTDKYYPDLSIDSNQNLLLTYLYETIFSNSIKAKIKPVGQSWDDATTATLYTLDDSTYANPKITIDNQDSAHIAWHDYDGTSWNHVYSISLDRTTPEVTLSTPANNSYSSAAATFTWSGEDNMSDLSYILSVRKTGNPATTYATTQETYSLSGLAAGTYRWYVTATDEAGNYTDSETRTLTVDASEPTISAGQIRVLPTYKYYVGSPTYRYWHDVSSVFATIEATDASSGVSAIYYRFYAVGATAPSYTLYTPGTSIEVSGEAAYYFSCYAVDNVGNVGVARSRNLGIDITDPTTTASASPTANGNGWNNSTVTVTMTATDDAGSGVKSTKYKTNGGVAQPYSAPFAILAQGTATIEYWAIDNVNNTEETKRLTVKIDTSAPSIGRFPDVTSGTYPSFEVIAGDARSGLSLITIEAGGTSETVVCSGDTYDGTIVFSSPLRNGTYTATISVIDAAGNSSTDTAALTVASALSVALNSPSPEANGYTSSLPTISWEASGDNAISSYNLYRDGTLRYSGTAETYSFLIPLSAGSHAVTVEVLDIIGNIASAESTILVDRAAPVTTGTASASPIVGSWYDQNLTVTLSPIDVASGVGFTYYNLDGAATSEYSSPISVSGDGTHSLTFYSIDLIGNQETIGSYNTRSYSIDTVGPTTAISLSPTTPAGGWYNQAVTTTISADDGGGSGVLQTIYVLNYDYGSIYSYNGTPISFNTEGTTTIEACSRDNVLLPGAVTTTEVKIDLSDPVITAFSQTGTGSNPTFEVRVSDVYSGLASMTIRVGATTETIACSGNSYSGTYTLNTPLRNNTYSVLLTITDVAGNSTSETITITVAASLSVTLNDPFPYSNGYTSSLPTFSWSSAGGAGLSYYSLLIQDRAGLISYRGTAETYVPTSELSPGNFVARIYFVDILGNSSSDAYSICVDASSPTTLADLSGTLGGDGWYSSAVEVTLSATDEGQAGAYKTYYQLNTSEAGSYSEYTGPLTISTTGTITLYYYSVDAVGNTESIKSTTLKIDTAAPSVSTTLSPATPVSGWYAQTVTATLGATDDLSGPDNIYYKWNADESYAEYLAATSIALEGANILYYYATDIAGNISSTSEQTVKIDTSSPEASFSQTGTGANPSFSISASDSLSQLNSISIIIGGTEETVAAGISAETYSGTYTLVKSLANGNYLATLEVVDNAGNIDVVTLNTTITSTVSATINSPSPLTNGYTDPTPTISWTASGDQTIASYRLYEGSGLVYSGTSTSYTFTDSLSDGEHSISLEVIDALDNIGTATATITVDATGPAFSTSEIYSTDADSIIFNRVLFTDSKSGIESWQITLWKYNADTGEWDSADSGSHTYGSGLYSAYMTNTFSSLAVGSYRFQVVLTDNFDNTTVQTNECHVGEISSVTVSASSTTINLDESVDLSALVAYQLEDGTAISYSWTASGGTLTSTGSSAAFSSSSAGTYTITACASAYDGEISASGSIQITVSSLTVSLSASSITLLVGETATLSAETSGISSEAASSYTWSASGGTISGSAETASFTPSASGTYTITVDATACDSSSQDAITITVNPVVDSIEITADAASITSGSTLTLTATIFGQLVSGETVDITSQVDASQISWTASGGTITSTGSSAAFSASTDGTYTITVTYNGDSSSIEVVVNSSGPEIEATIDGDELTDNAIISSSPNLSITITDNNGIDSSSITVTVDNEEVSSSYLSINAAATDQSGITNYTVAFVSSYALTEGTHSLTINAKDNSGTTGTVTYSGLQVSNTVAVSGIPMNYPNPFKPVSAQTTTIKYTLTADGDIKVLIFDITGKQIWSNLYASGSEGGKAGANYVTYDGKNAFGSALGNGVYHYFIINNGNVIGRGQIAVVN